MTTTFTVILSDQDALYITLVMARARRRGHDLGTLDELARHALMTYADFVDRMHSGELDGSPSAELVTETVPGLDPFREREIA